MKVKSTIITTAFLLFLSACEEHEDRVQKSEQQAIDDARKANPHVHREYLQCYALQDRDKRKCFKQLTHKYISSEAKKSVHYNLNYAYESEKLGFVNFLREKGAECDSLRYSPGFIPEAEAYAVRCTDGNRYFFIFDYDKKEWKLIK